MTRKKSSVHAQYRHVSNNVIFFLRVYIHGWLSLRMQNRPTWRAGCIPTVAGRAGEGVDGSVDYRRGCHAVT